MASQMVAYILNIFRTMLPIKLIRCVLFPTLLFISQQYPGADASGNSTNCRCCCIYEDKVYNLAPLQKDGPRFFEAVGTLNWEYAYSPCRSFSKGEPCPVGDVAVRQIASQRNEELRQVYWANICLFDANRLVFLDESGFVCRWDKNDPKGDHEVIGCQSTVSFTCDTDKPQLEYTAKKFYRMTNDLIVTQSTVESNSYCILNQSRNPDWKAIIRLECNPSLDKPDDAKFEVLQDNTTTYVFSLSHKCACPNGCPEEIPTSSPSQSTPPSTPVATITPATQSDKNLLIALPISGGILAITVCVLVIFYKCRKKKSSLDTERRCFMDQTGGSGEEKVTYQSNNLTDHLTDREDNGNQDPIKSFIKNPIGGSRSPSTSCKIRQLKKDNVNKLNAPL